MQAMVCELCGSNDIAKQDGFFVCQHCGTKYSLEEAKKLLGTVKIDKSEETEKLLVLARRARNENNSENAEKYYGMVLVEDPNNWEASFFQVYYQAMQCKIAEIANSASRIANCLDSNFSLIKEIPDEAERKTAVETIISYSINMAQTLFSSSSSFMLEHQMVHGVFEQHCTCVICIGALYLGLENALKKYFPDSKDLICKVQKATFRFCTVNVAPRNPQKAFFDKEAERLAGEIKEFDSSFESKPSQKGGCYVATAVYGSYDCPEVWTLRRYRDYTLAETALGRLFIALYYAVSPTLVSWFGKTQWFRNMWKPKLDKMVERLNREGVADTPYQDRQW